MRNLVLFISLIILLSGSATSFEGGFGTSEEPYQINDCQQLQDINTNLKANYTLIKDIDCSSSKT